MNIGFFVNNKATEQPNYTTTRLAIDAHNRGHRALLIDVDDFAYSPDNTVKVWGCQAQKKKYRSGKSYLEDIQSDICASEQIPIRELDVLMLRNDPSNDVDDRAWAQTVGTTFGQLAIRHGVVVLNDPKGLSSAANKLYFQFFPEEVRPKTLISRKPEEIKEFVNEQKKAVLKPLQGSGGEGVFLVNSKEGANLNQIIETLKHTGYIIAQEYLPAAAKGDIRLFLMNGVPLKKDGKYAAIRRVGSKGDIRNNVSAGGGIEAVKVTEQMLELADIVRPKLVQDGMFLVGLDIAGDKLMEINVFSPGGLNMISNLMEADFVGEVLDALEHKVSYMRHYGRNFDNLEIATL